jgi:hypothetical protein
VTFLVNFFYRMMIMAASARRAGEPRAPGSIWVGTNITGPTMLKDCLEEYGTLLSVHSPSRGRDDPADILAHLMWLHCVVPPSLSRAFQAFGTAGINQYSDMMEVANSVMVVFNMLLMENEDVIIQLMPNLSDTVRRRALRLRERPMLAHIIMATEGRVTFELGRHLDISHPAVRRIFMTEFGIPLPGRLTNNDNDGDDDQDDEDECASASDNGMTSEEEEDEDDDLDSVHEETDDDDVADMIISGGFNFSARVGFNRGHDNDDDTAPNWILHAVIDVDDIVVDGTPVEGSNYHDELPTERDLFDDV